MSRRLLMTMPLFPCHVFSRVADGPTPKYRSVITWRCCAVAFSCRAQRDGSTLSDRRPCGQNITGTVITTVTLMLKLANTTKWPALVKPGKYNPLFRGISSYWRKVHPGLPRTLRLMSACRKMLSAWFPADKGENRSFKLPRFCAANGAVSVTRMPNNRPALLGHRIDRSSRNIS